MEALWARASAHPCRGLVLGDAGLCSRPWRSLAGRDGHPPRHRGGCPLIARRCDATGCPYRRQGDCPLGGRERCPALDEGLGIDEERDWRMQ